MGNGQELVLQLALRQKPAAFGVRRDLQTEVVADVLNAVRLSGHIQILIWGSCGYGMGGTVLWDSEYDERLVAKVCEMITAMQVKGEKIEITTTPNTPEERGRVGFCRIDLRLKK
ncbi:hypothetical protein KKD80_02785 [Patescibacteria group bacterium]|nr:hypothetical protein [Patescibacteria group bacterium]